MVGSRYAMLWLACLGLMRLAQGYSSGAPDFACSNLTPGHGVPALTGPAPYTVTTSKTSVSPGEQMEVTVSGHFPLKGFFIRARQRGSFIGGQFQASAIAQLRCDGQGVTHNSPALKDSATVTWTAPASLAPGAIQFVATVVRERTAFWTRVPSADVAVSTQPAQFGWIQLI